MSGDPSRGSIALDSSTAPEEGSLVQVRHPLARSKSSRHWFIHLHPEVVPSAITRYQDEILRVFGVLEEHLKNREW